jgi:hypothetical protein
LPQSRPAAKPTTRNISQERIDAFVSAAHEAPASAIDLLRQSQALAHATATWGETAMQAASHLGHRDLISCLAKCGAWLDVFAACAMADKRTIRPMLASTAADACGIHGLPLLHFGIVSRDMSIVHLLLAAGVATNPPGASLSALHTAVSVGSGQMVRALVLAGADVAATDVFGMTALDWGYQLGLVDSELVDLLETDKVKSVGPGGTIVHLRRRLARYGAVEADRRGFRGHGPSVPA